MKTERGMTEAQRATLDLLGGRLGSKRTRQYAANCRRLEDLGLAKSDLFDGRWFWVLTDAGRAALADGGRDG